ncbi:MAG TPA: DUF177 domain-containing protein [Alphaproteobacteria bacterium]|jgi:uncharacterized metal-binding protein YceD (DUF177 family)|nr:DUF177 domain-containing protein [Alphaproteobacteria bacterium]MDP7163986.1 DUF177 domain-containing protein [Alphaproteobacteria bacterium]MDP7428888.1 DUF177 domain-containing protein [Alphaproteobacteria bacterium]HJM49104.1 DUF177 domain-containing protein [Alphaproteobacteria bacterium]|tara:strand:+ start:115 stop:690 length:576 start_codon:yes stop_codon:yes gene_type:complete
MGVPEGEFSRIIESQLLGLDGRSFEFVAEAAECRALAARLNIVALESLSATVRAERLPQTRGMRLHIHFLADVVQSCVVTLEPIAARIDERFAADFVPERTAGGNHTDQSEVTFSVDDEEPSEVLQHGKADVGTLIAEHLALALEPYPRRPGVVFEVADVDQDDTAVGVDEEAEGRHLPFAELRKRLNPDT